MHYHRHLFGTKHLEIQLDTYGMQYHTFNITISYNTKCDHAGFNLEISIGKYFFDFSIYDERHWNYKYNRWCTNEEQQRKEDNQN